MSRAVASAGATSAATSSPIKSRSKSGGASDKTSNSYFAASELPLTSLVFLLPMVILYEVGTRAFTFDPVHQTEQRIIAFNLLQKFFTLFGASGRYLPALAVVGVLLAWHIARRDGWRVRPGVVMGMVLESFVLALPLIVMSRVAEHYLAHVPLAGSHGLIAAAGARKLIVLSLGAGIYEELVFRLIAFTVLSFVFMDVLELHKGFGALLVVLISAVLFSGYHYLGDEPFRWWTFAFRAGAGAYFGAVFVCRGFGITAGCHAAYDLCVVAGAMLA